MKDKTEQIIKASTEVFVEKGYILATTKEIALRADVAEVTIFRKFGTKQKLFELSVRGVVDNKFNIALGTSKKLSKQDFFRYLLDDRLMMVSKNINVVKMLISESLANNLPIELQFTQVIFGNIKLAIEEYFSNSIKKENYETYSKLVGGILLSSVILPSKKLYCKLNSTEKEKYLDGFLNMI
jgi:AcrR family transcriptional regulator